MPGAMQSVIIADNSPKVAQSGIRDILSGIQDILSDNKIKTNS